MRRKTKTKIRSRTNTTRSACANTSRPVKYSVKSSKQSGRQWGLAKKERLKQKFMINETPVKVMTLLGIALSSMFFLFSVTVTNASFQGTENSFPDPFNPNKVVAVLDNAAASYSHFLAVNLFNPAERDLAVYQDTGRWIIDNSDQQILAYTGLSSLAKVDQPKVAGAYTDVSSSHQTLSYEGGSVGLFQLLGIR